MAKLYKSTMYDLKNFKSMLTAEQAADLCHLKKSRLIELAQTGYAPCVFVDNDEILFFRNDILDWTKANLVRIQQGKEFRLDIIVNDNPSPGDVPEALHSIANKLKEFRSKSLPCIYFLINGDEIVYVGQSSSLQSRLESHRSDKKEFDRVLFLPTPSSFLSSLEMALIRALKPKYNQSLVGDLNLNNINTLKEIGFSKPEEVVS
jgi:hypothetical protein